MEFEFHVFFSTESYHKQVIDYTLPRNACITCGSVPLANPTNCCEMVGPHHSHLQHAINYSFILLSALHFAAMLSMATGAGVELEAAADAPAGVLPFRWGSVGDEEAADVLT